MTAGHMIQLRGVVSILAILIVFMACAEDTTTRIGGETHWINVEGGRLKTQVFANEGVSEHPVLILVLHGDIPDPAPDYQYIFAKLLTRASAIDSVRDAALHAALGTDWNNNDIVAVGVLRPGYTDPSGDRSSGDMGQAVADNYTPEVVDAISIVARDLQAIYKARAVILVGHSGGGAVVADILGRHPNVANAALLVGCGCDPKAWRDRMRLRLTGVNWNKPNPSLMPLSLADGVAQDTVVRLVAGAADTVVSPADSRKYADTLRQRGVDARLTVVPEMGHNILITPVVFRELGSLVKEITDVVPASNDSPVTDNK